MYSVFSKIKLLYKPYTQQILKVLEPHELTELQWGLLRYLQEDGPTTFSEIAEYWQVEKPSVTPVAQKLIELGLIEVRPGKDKRQKVMHITELGQIKYKECKASVDLYQSKLLEGVSEQQIKDVNEVLEQLTSNVKKRGLI
ncbi:MarR family transcriptional regulator [Bacillus sp. IITD106]|nr:MarR family transcriptional regulator [Bacillus sp. IITD106]